MRSFCPFSEAQPPLGRYLNPFSYSSGSPVAFVCPSTVTGNMQQYAATWLSRHSALCPFGTLSAPFWHLGPPILPFYQLVWLGEGGRF